MSGSTRVSKKAGYDGNNTLEVRMDRLDNVTKNYITYIGC
jgi:hypothetical protein